ncbi:unnamed protein product [Cylicocyclus nassatus]|uniref:Chromo domain-containing protein n=1 Tax=Cylicocyclus nassatus TaxID=53992 RepID=A0AA36M9J6_CYLNA|nr:unnamed protein product [Cylicocyclus nassatus]
MSAAKASLCRRRYDELSSQFSSKIGESARKYGYSMESVDCCMKRLLKIAETRDPTPHDLTISAGLRNLSKEHLERFFHVFRELVQSAQETQPQHQDGCESPRDIQSDDMHFVPNSPPFIPDSPPYHHLLDDRRSLSPPPVAEMNQVSIDDDDGCASDVSSVASVALEDYSSSSNAENTEADQYEVERILSRTMNQDGNYTYHVKWVGYEINCEADSYVDEKDMNCPDLIKEFEQLERLRRKQQAKKLREKAELAKQRRLEAEARGKRLFCEVVDMCSSESSSDNEHCQMRYFKGSGKAATNKPETAVHDLPSSSEAEERKKETDYKRDSPAHVSKKHSFDAHRKSHKRIIISSSSSEDEEVSATKEITSRKAEPIHSKKKELSEVTSAKENTNRKEESLHSRKKEVSEVTAAKEITSRKAELVHSRKESSEITTTKQSTSRKAEQAHIRKKESSEVTTTKESISRKAEQAHIRKKETSENRQKRKDKVNFAAVNRLEPACSNINKEKEKYMYATEIQAQSGNQYDSTVIVKKEEPDHMEPEMSNVEPMTGDDDSDGGFRYVRRESDGFKKGYKAVKVSVVTEHPVTAETVGIVVFVQPDGEEFAQYIPMREIYENAPMMLRQYFIAANTSNQKELALSLILKKSSKIM